MDTWARVVAMMYASPQGLAGSLAVAKNMRATARMI